MEEKKNYGIYILFLPIIFTVVISLVRYFGGDPQDFYSFRWWVDDFIETYLSDGIGHALSCLALLLFYLIPIMHIFLFIAAWRAVITGVCTTIMIRKTKNKYLAFIYILTIMQLIVAGHISLCTMMSV